MEQLKPWGGGGTGTGGTTTESRALPAPLQDSNGIPGGGPIVSVRAPAPSITTGANGCVAHTTIPSIMNHPNTESG